MLWAVLSGAGSGAVYALFFWKLTRVNGAETFSHTKFARAVLLGGGIGAVANGAGMSFNDLVGMMQNIGALTPATLVADQIASALYKKFKGRVPEPEDEEE